MRRVEGRGKEGRHGRSRSPIRAHTGEVQTKCPPHIEKSGQWLYQGAQNFFKAFGRSNIEKNFMRPNDRIIKTNRINLR